MSNGIVRASQGKLLPILCFIAYLLVGVGLSVPYPILQYYLSFLYHPLLASFVATTDFDGLLRSLESWLHLVLSLLLLFYLKEKVFLFVGALSMALGLAMHGYMIPPFFGWTMILLAWIAHFKGFPIIATTLLSGFWTFPVLAHCNAKVLYVFFTTGLGVLFFPLLIFFVGLALLAIVAKHSKKALTTLFLVALSAARFSESVLYEKYRTHHDEPATQEECKDLDVKTFKPVNQLTDRPLWGGVETTEGLVVVAVGAVFLIDDDGRVVRGWRLAGGDRPFDIRLSSEGILVSFGEAVRLFKNDGTVETIFQSSWIPELMHMDIVGDHLFVAPYRLPIVVRVEPFTVRYFGTPSGLLHTGIQPLSSKLLVYDAMDCAVVDPDSLEVLSTKRFGWVGVTSEIVVSPHYIARGDFVRKRIDILDANSLELKTFIRVDIEPRFFTFSSDEKTLAVSDMLKGFITIYRVSDGVELARLRTGPRPRKIWWSERRKTFFGVSACGIYYVPPEVTHHAK